ncbi:DUF3015 domain-containing protein [Hydrocarboniclastica marina]|uniref:DUF3015 domain-containing protein n=1 Tax=Hydrocarboniclastica marina TaxID=2259620 RepID=A0A4P7XLQ3_9ALTE|nr:DUF3015 domain-containing protein [Hydrocarboniclastica marina]QCF26897.1 DUF3015 domain-containing protein [Hydrocarboniclastica marina]
MKKIIAGAVIMTASTFAFAQQGPGCGVGAMIWKGQSGPAPHILAATTNGTFGNQTFGMTTGTLGCDTSETIQSMAMYLDSNIDKVARDISRGEGENLTTLAVLMGIEAKDREHFNAKLKNNFAALFPSADTTADQLAYGIVELLEQDPTLSHYVG